MRSAGASSDAPLVPAFVGRYEVLLPIASGGMATVYLARARGASGFEREVALKVTHAHLREDDTFASDLIEEAKLAARIRHPNVVPVIDVGDDPVGVYLVMDYIEGETLSGLVRSATKSGVPLPASVTLRILVDVLEGLHAAHDLTDESGRPIGLVHRDFSPQNILVGLDGCPRLADFGVAKAATRLGHTKTGLVKGKIHYMPPEQVRSQAIDRRCDVWAAGIIAWELLARRRIYDDVNDTATILQIVSKPPPRVSSTCPGVPPALDAAIAHALAMDPELRCPTAADFAHELSIAATGAFGLASTAEVARHVRRIAGPALTRRRERVIELLRLRAQIGEISDTEAADQPTPSRVSLAAPRPAAGTPSEKPPAPHRETTEHVTALAIAPVLPLSRPRDHARRGRSAAIAASVLALLAGAVWIWRSSAALAPLALDVAASAVAAAPAADPPPSSEPATTAIATTGAAATARALPASLKISANAPVTALQIGERVVAIPSPATALSIDLFGDEGDRSLSVVATSHDGRRTTTTLEPGGRALELTFVAPVAVGARPPAASRTAPPPGAQGAPAPLAPSPYEPKK